MEEEYEKVVINDDVDYIRTDTSNDEVIVNNNNITEQTGSSSNNSNSSNKSSTENKKKNDATLGKEIGGLGGSQPFIQINGYTFSSRELIRMEIDNYTAVPKIELVVKLTHGVFISKHFPKDGDLISVFIRSYSEILKPISCDFLITKIQTSRSNDKEGSEITIFFDGILNVNYLYAEVCKGIKDKTSYEALLEIAKDLKLGFSSNDDSTNDKMNWICAYDTYKNWIENITIHSYKDDFSFYDYWIDYYYILNFVNLNKSYSVSDSEDAKLGIGQGIYQIDHNKDDNIESHAVAHHLTNSPGSEKTNYFYDSIEFINNSGEVNILNGYKRYLHIYDIAKRDLYKDKDKKHDIIFIDPMITNGSEKLKNVMKGRAGENIYMNTTKHKWQGIQYSTVSKNNVHDYWKISEFLNFQNTENLKKMMIKVRLPKANFNIYKGQRIPLSCVITKDVERGKVAGSYGKDNYKKLGVTLDRFLSSNNYVVVGVNLIYTQVDNGKKSDVYGDFSQEIILGRREWEIPTSVAFTDPANPYEAVTL